MQQKSISPAHLTTAGTPQTQGQELFVVAGGTIVSGDLVIPNGTNANHVQVVRADADAAATTRGPIWVAQHGASLGQMIRVAPYRALFNVDTFGSTVGASVYLSGIAGSWALAPGANSKVVGTVLVVSLTVGVVLLVPNASF